MKTSTTVFTSLLIVLFTEVVLSQPIVGRTPAEQSRLWHEQRTQAEIHARSIGIPIRVSPGDGGVLELQRFDGDLPVYYSTFNINAAHTISTDRAWPGGAFSLTGAGVVIGMWDGGRVMKEHVELGMGRVTQTDNLVDNSHSTHVAGTLTALGIDPQAKGMASSATLDAYDFNNDHAEMTAAAIGGMLLSNQSYGTTCGWYYGPMPGTALMWHWFGDPAINTIQDYRFGFYTAGEAQEEDNIAALYPHYLAVWAAGNDRNEIQPATDAQYPHHTHYGAGDFIDYHGTDGRFGYDCIPPTAVAKNVLTVGAVYDLPNGYSNPAGVKMTSFSSWGPTDDGRIKPDIVANGWQLYSCSSPGTTFYETKSGTSMAAPNVTGSIALLLQLQEQLNPGVHLLSSTIKALVIHTADEAGSAPGPDYSNGWGVMNTARAAEVLQLDYEAGGNSYLRELTLLNGETKTIAVYSNGAQPLRATICWTDPAGTSPSPSLNPATPMLVNDLDLRILKAPATFFPWVLNPAPASRSAAATTGDNVYDNVEQVHIAAPVAGSYLVQITHKGTLSGGSQKVSVVITGGVFTPSQPSVDWTQRFNNSAVNKEEDMGFTIPTDAKRMAHNLAVDAAGNVYVTGYGKGAATKFDYRTVKYNASGDLIWARTYGNGALSKGDDKAYAVAIDASGNVYVTGESMSTLGTGADIATVKYDAAGTEMWVQRYTGSGKKYDAGYAIVLSADGSKVFVAGTSDRGGSKADFITIAYNASTGAEVWAAPALYNGTGNGIDKAYAIALDPAGNVVVTGESKGVGTKADYATLKYDAATGTPLWVSAARFDGAAHKDDYPFAVAVDAAGNVYVTGGSTSATTDLDYATVKYTSSGTPAGAPWPLFYNNASMNKRDVAYAIGLDASGDVYVTGASQGMLPSSVKTGYDYVTIKYLSAGTQQWINRYDGGNHKDDIARAIAVSDAEGAVFITGSSDQGAGHAIDYATLRLPISGSGTIGAEWAGRYNGPAMKNDIAYAIALRPAVNTVVVTGTSLGTSTKLDYVTLQGPAGAPLRAPVTTPSVPPQDGRHAVAGEFQLFANYPNPFNPTTDVGFRMSDFGYVTLKVFNTLGQVLATLVNERKSPGEYHVQWNASGMPSGVYFYRLDGTSVADPSKRFSQTRKLMIVK